MSTPNDAFVEMVFETRREWDERPSLQGNPEISAWDEDRLLEEAQAQYSGLAAFLADEMVCAEGARVAAVQLGSLIFELKRRRRET